MAWYLHYDKENKPAGFFDANPDTPFIEITLEQKSALETDADSFRVENGNLIRITKTSVYGDYFSSLIETAPKCEGMALATDEQAVLLAVSGLALSTQYLAVHTPQGRELVTVDSETAKRCLMAIHKHLAKR